MPKVANWDDVVKPWADGYPDSTKYIYGAVIKHFLNFIHPVQPGQIVRENGPAMLQDYQNLWKKKQLPNTVKRKMYTVISMLGYGYSIGAIPVDVGRMVRVVQVPDTLAEKILPKQKIVEMINAEQNPRNKVLLMVLYTAGIRASEASKLRWLDCRERGKCGMITVLGKGSKKRTILLSTEVWRALQGIRPENVSGNEFVFISREGFKKNLSRTAITEIVKEAAKRVGISATVTAHWMRHGHATHALDAGAPLSLIQHTLGHSSIQTTSRYLHISPDKSSSSYVKL